MSEETSKQKAIREAYGEERYNRLKNYINDNGWAEGFMIKKKLGFIPNDLEEKFQPLASIYRPKLLQGIETNKGWIKIESDFPNEDVWVVNINGNKQVFLHNAYESFYKSLTHYQPIIKPQPPIY